MHRPTVRHAALFVLACVLLCAPFLLWPLGRDQGIEGATAMAWLAGHTPYRDVWNHSLPGGFAFAAVVQLVAGPSSLALRAADLALVITTALVVVRWLLPVCAPWCAWWAGAALVVGYVGHGDFWQTTQRDGFMLAPLMGALWFARRGTGLRSAALAGLLAGLCVLVKPGAVVLVLVCAFARRQQRRELGAVLLGAAAPLALFALWLVATGASDGFVDAVVRFNQGYAARINRSAATKLGALVWLFRTFLLPVRVEMYAALGMVAASGDASATRRDALVGLAVAFCVVATQAGAYPYHLLPLLAPLALASGVGLDAVARRLGRNGALVVAGLLLAPAAVACARELHGLSVASEPDAWLARFTTRDYSALEVEQVGRFVRRRAAPGDTLQVWGPDAGVALATGLLPATRYPNYMPLVAGWTAARERPRFLAALRARPPRFFVLERGMGRDELATLAGRRADALDFFGAWQELATWAQARYRPVASTPHLLVLERTP